MVWHPAASFLTTQFDTKSQVAGLVRLRVWSGCVVQAKAPFRVTLANEGELAVGLTGGEGDGHVGPSGGGVFLDHVAHGYDGVG